MEKSKLKAAGKKRLEEFRLKRQQKVEGAATASRAQSDLPDENEAGGENAPASSREAESEQPEENNQQPAENVSALEAQHSKENEAPQKDGENASGEKEREDLLERIKQLESRLRSSELDVEQKVTTIESLNSSLQRCREECERLEEERESTVAALARRKDEELEHLQKVVEDLGAGNEYASEEMAALRSELLSSEEKTQEALTLVELEKQKLHSRDEELGRLKAELAIHVAVIEDLERKKATEAVGLELLCSDRELQLQNASRRISELEAEKSSRDEELRGFEKLVEDLKGEKADAGETISALRIEVFDSEQKTHEALAEVEEYKRKLSSQDDEMGGLKAEFEELQKRGSALVVELEALRVEQNLRSEEIRLKDEKLEQLQKLVHEEENTSEALRSELASLEQEAQVSKEKLSSQDEEIGRLKTKLASRVSTLEEYEKRDEALRSQQELELRRALEEHAGVVEALRSELASSEVKAQEAVAEAEQGKQELLRRDEEITKLNGELSSRALVLEELERKNAGSFVELEALYSQLEKASGSISELQAEKAHLQNQLEHHASLRDQVSEDSSEKLREELEFELGRKLREAESVFQRDLEASKRASLDSLEGFLKKLESLSSSVELLAGEENSRLTGFQAQLAALENEALEVNSHAASLVSRVSDLEAALAEGGLERQNAAATIAQQDAAIRHLSEDVLQANSSRDQLAVELERLNELERERIARLEAVEAELKEVKLSLEEANDHSQKIGAIVAGACEAPGDLTLDSTGKVEHLAREFLALVDKLSASELINEELERANAELVSEKQARNSTIEELTRMEQKHREELAAFQKNDEALKSELDAMTSSLLELLPVEMVNKFSGELRLGSLVETFAGCYRESVQRAIAIEAQLEEDRVKLVNEHARGIEDVESRLKLLEGSKVQLENDLAGKSSELEIVRSHRESELQKSGVLAEEMAKLETQLASAKKELDAVASHRDRLQQELLESEQKLTGVREKLGLAIKKGKGLAQQRDELRQELAQKAAELDEASKQSSGLQRALAELETKSSGVEELKQEWSSRESSLMAELVATKRNSLELETLKQEWSSREKSLVAELVVLKRNSEELEKLKQDWSSRESSLMAELVVLKRRCGELLEEKQLLDESKREAWQQVHLVADQLDSARAELRAKSEAEARLRNSLAENKTLEQELMLVVDSLEAELFKSYEEKMAALLELDQAAKKLLRLVCSQDHLQAEQKPSPWSFSKPKAYPPRASIQSIKERSKVEASQILESTMDTKSLLEDMMAALLSIQQQGGVQGLISRLETKEQEFLACKTDLEAKERELEEKERLAARVEELEELLDQNVSEMGSLEFSRNKAVGKLTFTLGKLTELQQQCEAMVAEMESLQSNLDDRHLEITGLNNKVETLQAALEHKNESFSQLEAGLRALISSRVRVISQGDPIEALEAEFQRLQRENERLESRRELEVQALREQLEKFAAAAAVERSKIRGENEIELEEVEQEQKHIAIASAPHYRSQKKIVAPGEVAIDMEAQSFIVEEEKGNAFKSLGMIRYFPKAGHRLGDQIDALSLAAGRVLMRQPVARLSLILYWILVHFWIVASVSVAKL